ncbi:MAG: universal stress protein [Chloroflexi bacterium]|nr:universal stress protein [Chloroflexota bacterium]MCL5275391.1 universal stress protein [Chloroflexota bacterium]
MSETQTIFRHILVPTDGSQPSMTAGRLAVKLTALHKARITFVYVVDNTVAEELAHALGRVTKQVQNDLQTSGQRYLDYLSRLASEAGLAYSQVVRNGVPYEEIADLAREQAVDLIVIGQVGSRGSRRILIGSVTERVVEHAPCPVLVVK